MNEKIEKALERVAAYNRAYREANGDKIASQRKIFREANKEKIAAWQKEYREAHKEKKAAYDRAYYKQSVAKEHHAAHTILRRAVMKKKIIKPGICEKCWESRIIEGHHFDYQKPLDVVWLCCSCHRKTHLEISTGRIS